MPLFFLSIMVPVVLIGLCAAGFWIWMLVDCLNDKNLSGSQRCCWACFILFTHLVGAIVYYFAGRSPHTTPIVPFSSTPQGSGREQVPRESYRSYQEGYPIQHTSQKEQASSDPAPREDAPMQSQARYEDIQLAYPDEPR
jgi:hypothetical protein